MIRYICDHCGTPFDEPVTTHHTENLGEFCYTYGTQACPVCGCEDFSPADRCPRCGEAKLEEEILCKRCRDDLKASVVKFFDTLTAEEEAQFDNWMEGDTITNRKEWR